MAAQFPPAWEVCRSVGESHTPHDVMEGVGWGGGRKYECESIGGLGGGVWGRQKNYGWRRVSEGAYCSGKSHWHCSLCL